MSAAAQPRGRIVRCHMRLGRYRSPQGSRRTPVRYGATPRPLDRCSIRKARDMQAYRITAGGRIRGLARIELPDPRPAVGEVLIRVRATSLNYRDLMLARGSRDEIIPLSDGAGEVVAVGEGVTRFAVGDRVTSCFFPNWVDGEVRPEYQAEALGGGLRNGMHC